jgi:hypothetical protein
MKWYTPANNLVNMGRLCAASILLLCSTSIRVDAEQNQLPTVITALERAVFSPDWRYELRWKRNDHSEKHEIWLRSSTDAENQALLYSYERNADVLWSPDSIYVAITDRVGSSESFVRVFRIQSSTTFSEIKEIPQFIDQKYLTNKDGSLNFSHHYAAIFRWSKDSRYLEIELSAYDALDGSQRSLRERVKVAIPPVQ